MNNSLLDFYACADQIPTRGLFIVQQVYLSPVYINQIAMVQWLNLVIKIIVFRETIMT